MYRHLSTRRKRAEDRKGLEASVLAPAVPLQVKVQQPLPSSPNQELASASERLASDPLSVPHG